MPMTAIGEAAMKAAAMSAAAVVALPNATELWQLAKGTNAESRYIVVLVSGVYNVAARVKGGTVSIRLAAHGHDHVAQTEALTALGFDYAAENRHASMHLSATSDTEGLQALASVLMGVLAILNNDFHTHDAQVVALTQLHSLKGLGA